MNYEIFEVDNLCELYLLVCIHQKLYICLIMFHNIGVSLALLQKEKKIALATKTSCVIYVRVFFLGGIYFKGGQELEGALATCV